MCISANIEQVFWSGAEDGVIVREEDTDILWNDNRSLPGCSAFWETELNILVILFFHNRMIEEEGLHFL